MVSLTHLPLVSLYTPLLATTVSLVRGPNKKLRHDERSRSTPSAKSHLRSFTMPSLAQRQLRLKPKALLASAPEAPCARDHLVPKYPGTLRNTPPPPRALGQPRSEAPLESSTRAASPRKPRRATSADRRDKPEAASGQIMGHGARAHPSGPKPPHVLGSANRARRASGKAPVRPASGCG